jgi:uncharacterized protein (TIGR03435 family)
MEYFGSSKLRRAQYPGLFTALREQLGLELKPAKAAVDVVVVKSAKEPVLD